MGDSRDRRAGHGAGQLLDVWGQRADRERLNVWGQRADRERLNAASLAVSRGQTERLNVWGQRADRERPNSVNPLPTNYTCHG